jgi:hypothetical protein
MFLENIKIREMDNDHQEELIFAIIKIPDNL